MNSPIGVKGKLAFGWMGVLQERHEGSVGKTIFAGRRFGSHL